MSKFDIPPTEDNQQKKVVDVTQGDAAKMERAAARMEAMKNGTLAEFDAAEAMAKGEVPKIRGPVDYRAGNPDALKAAQEKMRAVMQGAPRKEIKYTETFTDADFKAQAVHMQQDLGDPRSIEDIVVFLRHEANLGHTMKKIGETEN